MANRRAQNKQSVNCSLMWAGVGGGIQLDLVETKRKTMEPLAIINFYMKHNLK